MLYYRFSEDDIGEILQMVYDMPDFMGCRHGAFMFATEEAGGYADFDYVRFGSEILNN